MDEAAANDRNFPQSSQFARLAGRRSKQISDAACGFVRAPLREVSMSNSRQAGTATEDAGHSRVAARVLEELARRRMSRASLAAAAKLSLSTVEKILSGRRAMTLTTIVRLEDALQVRLRDEPPAEQPASILAAGFAPDELGGYGRPAVAWLEGAYLTVRPSFSGSGAIYAYRTNITWNIDRCVLTFREAERSDSDFTQFGDVAVPHQSGHIYLATNRHGQHRLAIFARPTITGELHGLLTTLQAGRGSHLTPVSMPIAMQPMDSQKPPEFGRIPVGHAAHAAYGALLRRTIGDHFAQFVPF
jgi:transcriptional regulator with XRE-family HTH domain